MTRQGSEVPGVLSVRGSGREVEQRDKTRDKRQETRETERETTRERQRERERDLIQLL